MEESVHAVDQINADYNRHSRGAGEIARDYFSYDVVLPSLLEQAGVSLPSHAGRTIR
jgi:hypothetical protein